MSRLSGMNAIVTGAGGGIGLAIAVRMAQEGASVAAIDINSDLLSKNYGSDSQPGITPIVCDVTDRADVFAKVNAFAEKTGGLDILVNNAVMFHYARLEDFDPDIASRMIDVGLKGTLWNCQAAIPHLRKRGGGSIINLSSIAVFNSIVNASVYSSIKGAIDALTRQQAAELGPDGIRVNALAPGSVPTPGANSVINDAGWKIREGKSVLRRLPTADEIGAAAVFLASDDARSITGITLKVDAGMTITGP